MRSYETENDVQANPARPKQERTETMADRNESTKNYYSTSGSGSIKTLQIYLSQEKKILGAAGVRSFL